VTDIGHQYHIIESGAGWTERAYRGRIRIEGRDRVSFLQALVTNDLDALAPGRGVYTAYLTPQGRLVADLRLYDRGDHVLADVPAAVATSLVARLDGLVFAEDVRISDVSAGVASIRVIGAKAATEVANAVGADAAALAALPPLGSVDRPSVFVARSDEIEPPAFDVFFAPAERGSLIQRLQASAVGPLSEDVGEVLRIEAGRPAFGSDMDDHTIPLEAGLLERAISLTKGCYVGQEVIVRVLHRGGGRVARRLVKLAFDPALDTAPEAGTPVRIDGQDAGRITSAVFSPGRLRVIGLAYVPREAAEASRGVTASVAGREWRAEITGLAG
jgi:folate-binding protein YgfZ